VSGLNLWLSHSHPLPEISVSRWVGAKAVLLALTIASLSACQISSGAIILKPGFQTEFAYAAANNDFLVAIVGDPFGGERAALEREVLNAFQRNYDQFRTRFTTDATDNRLPPYKMVVVFGGVRRGAEGGHCAGTAPAPAGAGDGRLSVLAIFCGREVVAFNRASIPMPAGPGDPAFIHLLNVLAWQLLPSDDDVKPDHNYPEVPTARLHGTGTPIPQ
jgi:hypothetical protein